MQWYVIDKIIKENAHELEQAYSRKGLIARNDQVFKTYLAVQVFWVIGAIVMTMCSIFFSSILSKHGMLGFNIPAILWIVSMFTPIVKLQYMVLFRNYSFRKDFSGEYEK